MSDPNSMNQAGLNQDPNQVQNTTSAGDSYSMNQAGANTNTDPSQNQNTVSSGTAANMGAAAITGADPNSMNQAGLNQDPNQVQNTTSAGDPYSMNQAGATAGNVQNNNPNQIKKRELSPAAKAALAIGVATAAFIVAAGIHLHNKNEEAGKKLPYEYENFGILGDNTEKGEQLKNLSIETTIRDGNERTEYKSGDIEINLDGEALKNYNDINNKKNVNSLSTFSYDKATAKDKSDTELAKEFIENSVEKIANGEDMLSAVEVVAQNGYNPESEGFKIDGIDGVVDSKNEMTTLINEANSNKDLRDALTNKALETLDNEYDEYETGVLRYEGNYISSCATEIDGNKLAYHGGVDAATQGSEITIEQKFDEDGNNIYDINEVNSKKYNLLKNYNIIPNDASDEDALKIMSEYTVLGKSHDCEQMVVVRIDGDYATIMHIAVPEVPGGPEGTPDTAGNEGDGGTAGNESDPGSAGTEYDGKTAFVVDQPTNPMPVTVEQPVNPAPDRQDQISVDVTDNTIEETPPSVENPTEDHYEEGNEGWHGDEEQAEQGAPEVPEEPTERETEVGSGEFTGSADDIDLG